VATGKIGFIFLAMLGGAPIGIEGPSIHIFKTGYSTMKVLKICCENPLIDKKKVTATTVKTLASLI
jgi:H+/Cl- antiporter ClcA